MGVNFGELDLLLAFVQHSIGQLEGIGFESDVVWCRVLLT